MAKGTAVGLNKGFITTAISKKKQREKASYRKGKLGARVGLIRKIIRSVAGFTPYEKRMIELIKANRTKETKKALKFAKAKLGTHRRGMRKRLELEEIVRKKEKL